MDKEKGRAGGSRATSALKRRPLGAFRRARWEIDRMLVGREYRRSMGASSGARAENPGGPTARTLIPLPGAFGSFGDEAMARGIHVILATRAHEFLAPRRAEDWPEPLPVRTFDDFHALFRPKLSELGVAAAQRHAVGVVGADTVSGTYDHNFLSWRIEMLNHAARQGLPAALFNFSYPADPTAESIAVLRSMPAEVSVWARDPLSQERAAHVLGRDVLLAPDVAAMMPAELSTSVARELASVADRRVALVPNSHLVSLGLLNSEDHRRAWLKLIERASRDSQVVLLPHDIRDSTGDIALCHGLMAELKPQVSERVRLVVPQSAPEAKGVLSTSDVCISARMHAAVAALSSGVPCVGISYLGKFKGQFSFYGAAESVVDAATILSPDEIWEHSLQAIADRSRLRSISESAFGWSDVFPG